MMRQDKKFDPCRDEKGFSLAELLIAMTIGVIALAAFYSVFTIQNKRFNVEEQIVQMQQNVRAGMDTMIMEIRMAGYNPAAAAFAGVTVNAGQLEVRADLDADGAIAGAEDIIYAYDSANMRITRNTGGGAQPFMENVQSFTFQYLDSGGNVTADSALVRQIRISITGRTANRDHEWAANGGYRTYTLTSYVTPRNIYY